MYRGREKLAEIMGCALLLIATPFFFPPNSILHTVCLFFFPLF